MIKMPWEAPDEPSAQATKMPWETAPSDDAAFVEEIDTAGLSEWSLADTVRAIQADMRFAVKHTAVLARSPNELLRMVVNTERGQSIPAGACTFTDGSTVEFQDIGMPQPDVPLMTVQELVQAVLHRALEFGLELA